MLAVGDPMDVNRLLGRKVNNVSRNKFKFVRAKRLRTPSSGKAARKSLHSRCEVHASIADFRFWCLRPAVFCALRSSATFLCRFKIDRRKQTSPAFRHLRAAQIGRKATSPSIFGAFVLDSTLRFRIEV